MQSFFLFFFYLQKIAPQIAKKADNPPPTAPPTPPRVGPATGTPRTPGHPGLLILYRVRLLILDSPSRRSNFPCTGSGAIQPHKVRLIHPGGAVTDPGRWVTVGDGSSFSCTYKYPPGGSPSGRGRGRGAD
jgi:hypothetical protein